jgi:hypothetical protein
VDKFSFTDFQTECQKVPDFVIQFSTRNFICFRNFRNFLKLIFAGYTGSKNPVQKRQMTSLSVH